jgi:PIN domain nuclease of toxin-antitoxin system
MRLLLDTCTFLWIADKSESVPARVLRLYEAADNEVYLSAASAWEIAVKYAGKRLGLAHPPDRFVPEQREAHGILTLPIDEESALHMSRLPFLHRDPFDRLLVGQAIVHGLTILTPDPLIAQYPARVIW